MDTNLQKQPTDLAKAKKTFSRIGLALLAFYAASYAVQFGMEFFLVYALHIESISSSAAVLLSAVSMYAIGFPVCFLVLRKTESTPPPLHKARPGTLLVLTAIAFSLLYFGNVLGIYASAMAEKLFGAPIAEVTLELVADLPWYVAFLFAALIGPLVEECIFRKLIINRVRVYGEKLAILFSALLFAFFHMSVQQFFYAFFIGLVLGYLYIRTGSLLAVWSVHAAVNTLGSVVPLFLMQYCGYEELLLALESGQEAVFAQVAENPIGVIAVLVYSVCNMALLLLGWILLGIYRRKLRFEEAAQPLPRDTEGTVAFTGIGVVLFIAVCVLLPFFLSFVV